MKHHQIAADSVTNGLQYYYHIKPYWKVMIVLCYRFSLCRCFEGIYQMEIVLLGLDDSTIVLIIVIVGQLHNHDNGIAIIVLFTIMIYYVGNLNWSVQD